MRFHISKTAVKLFGLFALILLALALASPMPTEAAPGSGWTALTGVSGTGTSGTVNDLFVDSSGNLYVGGDFATAGGITVNDIALWDGTDWSGFTGPSATGLASGDWVNGLAVDSANQLYIAGSFGTVGGLPGANRGNGAKWDGSQWLWLDATLPYNILTAIGNKVVIDASNSVYFVGAFGGAGDTQLPVNFITRYTDFGTFVRLTDATTNTFGANGTINAIALHGGNVYVGGLFTLAGGVANTARVAMYNGTNWLPLGAGIDNGQVNALAFDSQGILYAGGTFTSVNGGTAAAGIAMWDGATWSALGSGIASGGVNALAVGADDALYVGGNFTSAGGLAGTARLARWSGGWRALPEGTPNSTVNVLRYDATNHVLYVGGAFTQAGSPAVTVNQVAAYQPVGLVVDTAVDQIDANSGACTGLTTAQLPGPGGFTSLREAICAANTEPGADTISFDASLNGTPITLSIPGTGEDANATGDLDISDDLTIAGNGAQNTIVQAGSNSSNGIDRVFQVTGNYAVSFTDVTIRYGRIPTASGGGIYNTAGTVTVNGSAIRDNYAGYGGGITNDQGTVTLVQSTVSGNTAVNNGGGVDSDAFGATATLNVYNSTLSGNSAGYAGGAILAYTGGAAGATVNLVNATIHNNNAAVGGVTGWNNGGGAVVNMQNSLIADQTGATADCASIGGVFTSNNHNLDSDNTCYLSQPNDIPNGAANLGALQNNGGETETHALLSGSQAINAGANAACTAAPINGVDQRGVPRPQGAACDIGAYEYVAPVTPGAAGGNGPGGVGVTDGSTALEIWLRADKGTYADPACTTAPTVNGDVACWQDQSGNSHHATVTGAPLRAPFYRTNILNSFPTLGFNGSNDRLATASLPLFATNSSGLTTHIVFNTQVSNSQRFLINQGFFPSCTTSFELGYSVTGVAGNFGLHKGCFNATATPLGTIANNTYYIMTTAVLNSGTTPNNLEFAQNGSSLTVSNLGTGWLNAGSYETRSTPLDIGVRYDTGGSPTYNSYHQGDIAEIIIYTTDNPQVRRILADNYLSAKYAIALSANDVYDGDANGDFDLDVAGIGRFGGSSHTQAHGAGMIVVNRTFLNDNGDWLLFGHKTPANAKSSADLPTTGDWASAASPMRWARHWYIDVTDAIGTTGGTVDIVFDFSEAGMAGGQMPSNPANNYRLLKRDNPTGQFADIATATAVVGDQVHFQNVNVSLLGSNFTLGTLNDGASPTAVTLSTTSTTTQNTGLTAVVLSALVLAWGTVWLRRRAR